jgi:RNA polymerase sigma-70 factor (ECF subfamily)
MTDELERVAEELLVLRCQTGDPAAFAGLVDYYSPRLRYFLRKLLGASGPVDDTLQEVWLDVFRSLHRLATSRAFRAWLYRIARDRAFRTLRRRRPATQLLEEEHVPWVCDAPSFHPDEAAQVHAALEQLTPEHREVLVLRFLEDMSYEEISRVAGCPLGTVRSRLFHARRHLRALLDKETDNEREQIRRDDASARASGQSGPPV